MKKVFLWFFSFQTKLGDYQAGYTDDQCFCYDEVKSWFFLQFLLNQVFFESSELAKAWWLRLNDRPPQYGRLCARMPQGGRGRSFKVTEKDAIVHLRWDQMQFRSDLGVGHFPDGYYRPCEKLHIEHRWTLFFLFLLRRVTFARY